MGLGISVVYAYRMGASRFRDQRWFQLLPMVSAAFLVAVGIWLCKQAVQMTVQSSSHKASFLGAHPMMPTDWHELHKMLTQCPWFANVGQWKEGEASKQVRRMDSWSDAQIWAKAEISWWCVNEASNIARNFLHTHHNKQYQDWNRHFDAFDPAIKELINGPIKAALPPKVGTPAVKKWIRSHLGRAYVECVYFPLSKMRLVYDQVEWFLKGHFPCGWFVEKPSAFPDRAVTVVY